MAKAITKQRARDWILTHYTGDTPETRAALDCLFRSKEVLEVLAEFDAMAEHYRAMNSGEGNELEKDDYGFDRADGFTLSSLVECYDHPTPHTDDCPEGKDR